MCERPSQREKRSICWVVPSVLDRDSLVAPHNPLSGSENMRFVLYGIYLLSVVFYSCSTVPEPAHTIAMDDLLGEWLNKRCIEELQSTRSPCSAVEGIHYTAFIISREDDVYRWLQAYYFHEGLSFRIVGLQPTSDSNIVRLLYHRDQDSGRGTLNDRFYIPDGKLDEIDWLFTSMYEDEEQRIAFVRVEPSIDEYVSRIVIAGQYTDEGGREFVFRESGEAKWPDKTFRYRASLDPHWTRGEFDSFYVLGEKIEDLYPMRYGFEWRDRKLLIFEIAAVREDTAVDRVKEPLHVLTPRQRMCIANTRRPVASGKEGGYTAMTCVHAASSENRVALHTAELGVKQPLSFIPASEQIKPDTAVGVPGGLQDIQWVCLSNCEFKRLRQVNRHA